MWRGLALVAVALVLAPPAPAGAQDGQRGLSAVDLFTAADAARAEQRIDDAEAIYRALSNDPEIEVRTEARFRLGMMLSDLGRQREAAVAFRALLDEQPNAPRVRIELARVLATLGDEGAARRELRQARAAGLPPDVARAVDQFVDALRSRRGYGFTVEAALAPDTNINRATDARTLDTVIAPLDLSDDARARSGLGVKLAGQAFARVALGDRLALLPRVSGIGDLYGEGRFNDVSASAQLGVEREALLAGRLTVSAGQSRRWYGNRPYAVTSTVTADWLRPLGPIQLLTLRLSAGPADYRDNDLQDGWLFDASVGVETALTARSGASLSLGLTRQDARDPGYANVAGGLTGVYYRELGRMTGYLNVAVRRLEADERLFIFPSRRREWFGRLGIGATFRQATVAGLAPLARVTIERNRSSVGLYDYRRLAFELGASRAF